MKSLILCFASSKRPLSSGDQSRPFPPMNTESPSSPVPSKSFIKSLNDHNSTVVLSEPESEPDFSTVFASGRFFFSSPGCSNSIVESSPSISTGPSESPSSSPLDHHRGSPTSSSASRVENVVVDRCSSDPYADFRRSMEEIVEARGLHDVKASWDYLHELLLCYLVFNHKSAHGFITGAFADLLTALMSS